MSVLMPPVKGGDHGIFEVVVVSDGAREMRKLEKVMRKLSTVGP